MAFYSQTCLNLTYIHSSSSGLIFWSYDHLRNVNCVYYKKKTQTMYETVMAWIQGCSRTRSSIPLMFKFMEILLKVHFVTVYIQLSEQKKNKCKTIITEIHIFTHDFTSLLLFYSVVSLFFLRFYCFVDSLPEI